jgi:putative salt-induced outer membrane protein YdiY
MRLLLTSLPSLFLVLFSACHTASIPFEAPQEAGAAQEPQAFKPAPPSADKFDWIQLKSGEWLKGEIEVMRDGSLEFDSDELDGLKLDMDDIIEIRSAGDVTVLVGGRQSHTGTLTMKDGKIRIEAAGKDPLVLERAEVLAIVPGLAGEGHNWSGKVSLGATLRSGNTDQTDITTYLFARRDTAATRWDTKYNGAYSEVSGIETANNQRLDSRFDWFLTKRLFVTPLNLTYFRDPFQNIGYRLTAAAYLGYDVISENKMSWDISVGPAYQESKADSSQSGVDDTDGTAAAAFGTHYEWDLTGDIEFDLDYSITIPVPDTQNYNHHLQAMFSIDLVGSLELDISFIWDRFNNPLTDSNGVTPKKDDFRTVIGIGFDF